MQVRLLKEKAFTELAVKIKLLEPLTRYGPHGTVTFPVGSVLSVGAWQVKEEKEAG